MGLLDRIFGGKKKEEEGYRIFFGECTRLLYDIAHGTIDVSDPKDFESKCKIAKCTRCGLLDAVLRESIDKPFRFNKRCPRCKGKQEPFMT